MGIRIELYQQAGVEAPRKTPYLMIMRRVVPKRLSIGRGSNLRGRRGGRGWGARVGGGGGEPRRAKHGCRKSGGRSRKGGDQRRGG